MFPGGNFGKLELRSNRGLPRLCVHVLKSTLLRCVLTMLLTGLLRKVNMFSLFPRLLVSPQHLRLLMAGGVEAFVTDTPFSGVLSNSQRSGATSTLRSQHHYSVFPPSFLPTLICHFPEASLLGGSHLQTIYAL